MLQMSREDLESILGDLLASTSPRLPEEERDGIIMDFMEDIEYLLVDFEKEEEDDGELI